MEGKFNKRYGKVARAAVSAALTGAMLLSGVTPAFAAGDGDIDTALTYSISNIGDNQSLMALKVFEANIVKKTTGTQTDYVADTVSWGDTGNVIRNAVVTFLNGKQTGFATTGATETYEAWLTRHGHSTGDGDIAQNALEYISEQIKGSAGADMLTGKSVNDDTFAATFAKAMVDALGSNTTLTKTLSKSESSLTNVGEGYWLVADKGADAKTPPLWLPISGSTGAANSASIKGVPATIEKTVDDDGTEGKITDLSQGNTARFKVTVKPSPEAAYYLIEDVLPAGMSIVEPLGTTVNTEQGISVMQDGKNLKDSGATVGYVYDAVNGNRDKLTITIESLTDKAKPITIEYTAAVDADVSIGAAELNANEAILTFAKTASDTKNTTSGAVAKVATYELDLRKVDNADASKIAGAKFTIQNSRNEYLTTDGGFEEVSATIDDSEQYAKYLFTTGADGTIVAPRIDAGDYTIKEITAGTDYEGIGQAIKVTISAVKDQVAGTITELGAKTTVDANNAPVQSAAFTVESADANTGVVLIQVKDKKLIKLPITGMTPSQLGTVMGAVLIAAGAVAITARRRQGEQA